MAASESDKFRNGLCKTCSEELRACLACGKLIEKGRKYLEFDGVGPYCQACYKERQACDVCTAPLTNDYWRLSDGRLMCVHCYTTAIYAPGDAASLYEEMKGVVVKTLGITLNVPTGLALVDRNQLAAVIHQQQELIRASGNGVVDELDPQRTLGVYTRRGMRRGIYIQTGLPRLLFLQVAAHEYAHAWQGENCPLLRDTLVHEGFAEWAAYRVLGHYGYKRGQERMLARTDIYGRGLKWALDLESNRGPAGVMDACRRSMPLVKPGVGGEV
ncbi:MAG: zinc-binding protein [Chloroflexota bacterium]